MARAPSRSKTTMAPCSPQTSSARCSKATATAQDWKVDPRRRHKQPGAGGRRGNAKASREAGYLIRGRSVECRKLPHARTDAAADRYAPALRAELVAVAVLTAARDHAAASRARCARRARFDARVVAVLRFLRALVQASTGRAARSAGCAGLRARALACSGIGDADSAGACVRRRWGRVGRRRHRSVRGLIDAARLVDGRSLEGERRPVGGRRLGSRVRERRFDHAIFAANDELACAQRHRDEHARTDPFRHPSVHAPRELHASCLEPARRELSSSPRRRGHSADLNR